MDEYPEFKGFNPDLLGQPQEGSYQKPVINDTTNGAKYEQLRAAQRQGAREPPSASQWTQNAKQNPWAVKLSEAPSSTPSTPSITPRSYGMDPSPPSTPPAAPPQSPPPAAAPSTQKATASKWRSGGASILGGLGGGWVGQKIGEQAGAPEAGMTIGSGIGAIGGAALAGGPMAALRYGVGPIVGGLGGQDLGRDIGGVFDREDQGAQIGTVVGGLAGMNPYTAALLMGYGVGHELNPMTASDSTGGLGIGDALIRGTANLADWFGITSLNKFADANENRVASERSSRINPAPFLAALNDPQKRMEVFGIAQKYGGPGPQFSGILQQWFGSKEGQAWLGSEEGRKWAASPAGVSLFGQQTQQNAAGGVPVPQVAAIQANQPGAAGPKSGATVTQRATGTAAQPGPTYTITSDANGSVRLGLTQPGTKGTGTIEIPDGQTGEAMDRATRMAEGQKWLQRTGGNTFKNAAALAGDSGFATANTPSGNLLTYRGGATRLADGTIWSPEIAAARQQAANEGRWGDVNRSLGLAPRASLPSSASVAKPQTLAEMLHGPAQGGGDFIAKASMRHELENAMNEMSTGRRSGGQMAQAYANLLGQHGGGGQATTKPDHALQLEDMRHRKAIELERLRQSGTLENEQFKSQLALQNGLALEQARAHPEIKMIPQYDKMGIQTGVIPAIFDRNNQSLSEVQIRPVGKSQTDQGAQAAAQNKLLYESLSRAHQKWWDEQRAAGKNDDEIAAFVRSKLPSSAG